MPRILALAVAATLVASPAFAGWNNGLNVNGLNANGWQNGLNQNALNANGWQNGINQNAIGSNGIAIHALSLGGTDGLKVTGIELPR